MMNTKHPSAQLFAKNLQRIAIQKGITKQYIAKSLNLHWDTVNKWFKGERTPSLEKLYELAKLLDVSVEELLTEQKPEPFEGYWEVMRLPVEQRFEKVFELAAKHAGFNGPILHAVGDRIFKDEVPRLETEEEIVAEYQKWRAWWEEKKKLLLEG